MATDNRIEDSLFPDVTEHYDREPATAESAPQAPPGSPPEPEQASVLNPAPVQDVPVDAPSADAVPPETVPSVDPALPDEFDQMPTWLVAPESAAPEQKKREKREKSAKGEKRKKPEKQETPEKPEKRETTTPGGRKPLLIGGVAVLLLAIASAATAVVVRGGDTATEGTPKPVAVASPSTSVTSSASAAPQPSAPVPVWCADSTVDGRSVGRGPGSTSDGPGVIRAFDHAYYVERSGARVASLMVAPNAVPEIQKWIDEVPVGSDHCVTITSTPDPNVYNVELGLRMPGAAEGVIRQRITVAPSPAGFKIAKVEDTQ
ncbi:hypothetical protein [Rhodococcus sp. ACT016]|uniref:hypothetical protein n=1 Tax=Rhodococcus sp. ACT016 TaxID=3134808 RepID=UPI003D2D4B4F